ncbi:MAG TPA: diol dehydratase reactivase ATPase-like domain-containing protein [Streptosporangiaceae bacterium]|nr:diol dehydratase reactivase ATPase-like domain-containing protein [Streptosporangiaceae bacterium]
MTTIAGVDIGNATTEVAVLADGKLLGVDRLPTRGRKGSAESVQGAAALLRRVERRLGIGVTEASIAPLRAADTATLTVPALPPRTGRLTVLAAGVATPGGAGICVGRPFTLDNSHRPVPSGPLVALVPPGLGYVAAAGRVRELLAEGVPVGAVLTAGDEGVLIANRLGAPVPVLDQVDTAAAGRCPLLAVEVRPTGRPLTMLTDPVALGAALGLGDGEAADAVSLSRLLLDYANAVIGLAAVPVSSSGPPADLPEPWLAAGDRRLPLRTACADLAAWPPGTVTTLGSPAGPAPVDDLFALDLGQVADTATARQGGTGRTVLVASLHRTPAGVDHAALLTELTGRPVRCLISEPAAARLGALTTPGARPDAAVIDIGAGTIDVIGPDREVVAAGAGDLLTAAVAETLALPRAAADWVKRGPCLRVTGSQQFEAEDGSHGFLDRPAAATALGMLAAPGPAGLLPFDRRHSPAEWRAIRLRLKEAVFAVNLRRVLRGGVLGGGVLGGGVLGGGVLRGGVLDSRPGTQMLIVGGPAGDDELLGVLLRSLGITAGRGNAGGTLPGGPPAGHRYAAALGLALAAADG